MTRSFFQIVSNNDKETHSWGKRLADFLKPGDVVALYGELGSGKTVFAQGVCAGLEVHNYVTSPSFTLIQEYQGRLPVFHFDFYRLTSEREIEDLGVHSYWESEGVSIIEWADRGEPFLPKEHISVKLDRYKENGKIMAKKRLISIGGPVNKALKELYCECAGH